jgi:uncharacterized protein (DUF305 family)
MKHVKPATAATAALIITAALGVAGCGDGSGPGSMPGMSHANTTAAAGSTAEAAAAFNDADVTFATQMIPHHQQAVQVASMAGYQATTSAVKQLATAIKATRDPEIKQMSAWLTSWGQPVPTPSHGGDHMSEMPGMMTEDQMSELGNTAGTMFDRMWTQMMIKHHQAAVTAAKTEQAAGKNTAAITLAKKIETDQNKEIASMKRLFGILPVS